MLTTQSSGWWGAGNGWGGGTGRDQVSAHFLIPWPSTLRISPFTRHPPPTTRHVAGAPGHLVDLNIARDVAGARQEAAIVPLGLVELGGDSGNIDELPDLDLGAYGQPATGIGHAHRCLERAEVSVQVVSLVTDHHQLPRLICGDQQRGTEPPQQRREIRCVDGPQRLAVVFLGTSRDGPVAMSDPWRRDSCKRIYGEILVCSRTLSGVPAQ